VRRVGRVRFIIIPFKDLLESTDSGTDGRATTVPKLTLVMRRRSSYSSQGEIGFLTV
jgi:hypothetical protein